jgi:tetratricopeptide (TPR) repeat protein
MFIQHNTTSPSLPPQVAEPCGQAVQLLQAGQYAAAYLLLTRALQSGTEFPALHFNLALCLLYAGGGEKALSHLDKGLELLKSGGPQESAPPRGEITAALDRLEAETGSYKSPMHPFEPELFPARCRDRFLRLTADACAHLGDHARVRRIADLLKPKNYRNLIKALQKIETE